MFNIFMSISRIQLKVITILFLKFGMLHCLLVSKSNEMIGYKAIIDFAQTATVMALLQLLNRACWVSLNHQRIFFGGKILKIGNASCRLHFKLVAL